MLEYVIPSSYSPLLIVFQGMNISPIAITPGPTTPTAPKQPTTLTTTTQIQGSKKSHETPVTTQDPEITIMATKETTHAITSIEIDVPNRKNDYICFLYEIICFFKVFTLRRTVFSIHLFFSRSVGNFYKINN